MNRGPVAVVGDPLRGFETPGPRGGATFGPSDGPLPAGDAPSGANVGPNSGAGSGRIVGPAEGAFDEFGTEPFVAGGSNRTKDAIDRAISGRS